MIPATRQGVAYTLGLTLLAIAILSLSVLVYKGAQSAQSQAVIHGAAQKISDAERSIQEVFAETIHQKTTLRFSSTLNSVTFNETLPQNMTNATERFVLLKENIERDFPFISINTSSFENQYQFMFVPGNIGYVQESPSKVRIQGGSGGSLSSVLGYNITLVFPANITSCVGSLQPGSILTVSVMATSLGSSCIIPPTSVKEMELQMVSEGRNIQLKVEEDKELMLESQVMVKTSITAVTPPLSAYGHLEIPITLETNDTALSYYRKTKVRIVLLS